MTALLIPVMIVVPALCFAWVLSGLDPLGRAMVGLAASLCLFTLVAQLMLIFHLWSPVGGAAVVGGCCLGLAGFALRRRSGHRAETVAATAAREQEDEDWLFAE